MTLLNHNQLLARKTRHLPHSAQVRIDSIIVKDTVATVYNFTVARHHNYYVGNVGGLVHNNECDTLWAKFAHYPKVDDVKAKVQGWKDTKLEKDFLKDIEDNNLATKVFNDLSFVDGWLKLSSSVSLRKNIFYLEKVSKYIKQSAGNNNGVVSYFRVQGGTPPLASRHHFFVDSLGNVRFKNNTLNISTGDMEHARYFQSKRPGSKIYSFDVPKWFDNFLKEYSIPQANYRTNPMNQGGLAPRIVDPTQPGDSFELPGAWGKWLQENYIKGSGKIID